MSLLPAASSEAYRSAAFRPLLGGFPIRGAIRGFTLTEQQVIRFPFDHLALVVDLGAPWLEAASRRWPNCPAAATLSVYLGFLAEFPDTHIQRKHGLDAAIAVQREAAPLYALSQNADDPAELWARALLFDASLKQRRLNPGASADLTVATLFAGRLRDLGLPDFSPDVLRSRRNND